MRNMSNMFSNLSVPDVISIQKNVNNFKIYSEVTPRKINGLISRKSFKIYVINIISKNFNSENSHQLSVH